MTYTTELASEGVSIAWNTLRYLHNHIETIAAIAAAMFSKHLHMAQQLHRVVDGRAVRRRHSRPVSRCTAGWRWQRRTALPSTTR